MKRTCYCADSVSSCASALSQPKSPVRRLTRPRRTKFHLLKVSVSNWFRGDPFKHLHNPTDIVDQAIRLLTSRFLPDSYVQTFKKDRVRLALIQLLDSSTKPVHSAGYVHALEAAVHQLTRQGQTARYPAAYAKDMFYTQRALFDVVLFYKYPSSRGTRCRLHRHPWGDFSVTP